ncbi:MAG: T9SS type A sorting domain-containing protein [Melioribacteraceae bacterium]|nr:T9SS type A sorting domain-containing protein [Melioribacteraceae bacterium]
MKKVFVVVFFISNVMFTQTTENPLDYFPHSVGDYWEYSVPGGTHHYQIYKDSIDNNGNKYLFYKWWSHDVEPIVFKNPRWMIDTNYNVYLYHPIWLTTIFYKLDAKTGDEWWYNKLENKKATITETYNFSVLGHETTLKRIEYYQLTDTVDTTINENSYYLGETIIAKDLGMIYDENGGGAQPDFLTACIIGGDTLGIITDIVDKPVVFPENIILKQNYPNPFNPSTVIEFELKEADNIKLEIFDVLGKKIVTLFDDYKSKGKHKVQFKAHSNDYSLSSGIYLYVLKTSNKVALKKMILTK